MRVFFRTYPPTDEGEAEQPQANPDQFAEPPEQRKGDAGDVGVAEGFEEEQIAAILRAEAAGDEERATFDEDRERADGDGQIYSSWFFISSADKRFSSFITRRARSASDARRFAMMIPACACCSANALR